MSYIERLKRFNETEKYKSEMEFMRLLLEPGENHTVLDYGCGLGTFAEYIKQDCNLFVYGLDKTKYWNGGSYYVEDIYFQLNRVSFMHSIAHIENIEEVLISLQDYLKPLAKIAVITPNLNWLEMANKEGYQPDPTVIRHFTEESLISLFQTCGYKIALSGQFGKNIRGLNERLFLLAEI